MSAPLNANRGANGNANPSSPSGSAWPSSFPEAVRNLDTRRHALFEASAGTGKTYAIEHIVLRLLVENPGWNPEEILLLSFTEKTAADLRRRIRVRLHAEWAGRHGDNWTAERRARIQKLWQHCDDLAIHTIHGFCHAALLRDPIANNALIRPEVLDDKALAREALENLLRGAWATDTLRLARLREALDISGRDGWRERLIALALAVQEQRGDTVEPAEDPGMVEPLEEEALAQSETLIDAMRAIENGDFPISAFRASFGTKTSHLRELNAHAFEKLFKHADKEEFHGLSGAERRDSLLAFFSGKFNKSSNAVKDGFASQLRPECGGLKEWTDLAEACEALRRISKDLGQARELRRLGLQAEAARELRAELAREKRRRGGISYDDMTQNLAQALKTNPELAGKLRRRYKACIVDEFQDTDLQQWDILQALCLHGVPQGTRDPKDVPPDFRPSLPLFLVGDPKQAIYSFRGGDLQTYLAACDMLRALAEQNPPRAQGIALTENFRSSPALIESLNTVFEQPAWFGRAESADKDGAWKLSTSRDIVFTRVEPGLAQPGDRASGRPPASAAPALWVRNFRPEGDQKPPAKRTVEREVRRWVAARILELSGGRDGLTIQPKDKTAGRAPRYGDIAVLVRKHTEAAAVEKLLRKLGIPCRVRRAGGVFHGEGAEALRLLLDLIPTAADPGTQAKILLLPFLRRNGTDWPEGRPAEPPPLLERWMFLARAGRWPEFFDSVLRDGGHLARVAEQSESDAARLLALGRALGEAGSTPGTSAAALADRFDALRRGEGEGDEGVVEDGGDGADGEDRQDAATGGAVTVMTLHMSKGLEFPVVFMAATGAGKRPDFHTLREEHGFRHVLDKKDEATKTTHENQVREEDKRLFYVAFTRAKDRLYAPLLPAPSGNTKYGPLGDFAADAIVSAATCAAATSAAADGRQAVVHWDTHPIFAATAAPAPVAAAKKSAGPKTVEIGDGTRSTVLTPEQTAAAFARLRHLNSYSGLSHLLKRFTEKSLPTELLGEDGKRAVRDEVKTTEATGNADGTQDAQDSRAATAVHAPITREDLPAGAAAGNALHGLLELTEFASVHRAETSTEWLDHPGRREQIEHLLRKEGLDPRGADAVARIVWHGLRMPLPDPAVPGAKFRLADNAEHLHEVEFLFPVANEGKGLLPEDTGRRGDFLWGFIDLVFRHEGRYYLLDWKSNLLEAYDEATVKAAMLAAGYDLQWQLYAVALDLWLQARLPGYDPEEHFGGVLYLYLRGAPQDGFSGFAHRPTVEELRTAYPRRLEKLLNLKPVLKPSGAPA